MSGGLIAGRYIADSADVSGLCTCGQPLKRLTHRAHSPERDCLCDFRGLLAAFHASSFTPFGFAYFLYIYSENVYDIRS